MTDSNHQRALGVFSDQKQVEQSLNELNASGFPMDHVSVVVKRVDEDDQLSGVEVSDRIGDQSVRAPLGIVGDTLVHSSWAFVLAGLSSLALPGIGPILAAGSLGAALAATTASTGASLLAENNVVKALTQLGVPQEKASRYSDRLLLGDYLVMVEGQPTELQNAEQTLSHQGIKDWGIYTAA